MSNNITVLDAFGSPQVVATIQTGGVHVPQSQNISESNIGAAIPNTAIMVGGSDGTNLRAIATDATGNIKVLIQNSGAIAVSQSAGPWSVTSATSSTANSPAQQSVGTGSVTILAANSGRVEFTVVNTGTTTIYLALGGTPTGTAYHIPLTPCGTSNDGTGGSYTSDVWKGVVNAIGNSSGGTVVVTQLT